MKDYKNTFLISFLALIYCSPVPGQTLLPELQKVFGTDNVKHVDSSIFKEYYVIQVPQLVDHNNETKGSFKQQVLLGFTNKQAINVMETEGYWLSEQDRSLQYKSDLTRMMNANQIIIEHRYFGESVPDTKTKTFLTYEQAAADDHYIKQKLSYILSGKWISTGLSKSGDAALAYRFLYPDDVDATVVFGTSIGKKNEDPRFETFIKERRKTVEGKNINEAQLYLLKNMKTLLPVFEHMMEFTHQDLKTYDAETIYDYGVLELEPSFWQYYTSYENFKNDLNPRIDGFLSIKGFEEQTKLSSFEDRLVIYVGYIMIQNMDKKIQPHYYQAFSQSGYYGYDEAPFLQYLKNKNYSLDIFAGEKTNFDGTFRKNEKKYTETIMEKVIFIYGENDPWSFAKIVPSKKKDNLVIITENGNHNLTISGLPKKDNEAVKQKLRNWLQVNL